MGQVRRSTSNDLGDTLFRRRKMRHRVNMLLASFRARAFSGDEGAFHDVKNARVLIYFPHGFGDWVQLAYVLPALEPSNRYWITRSGDNNVSVMEGNPHVTPVYLGNNVVSDGDDTRHLGMGCQPLDGTPVELWVPPSLYDVCSQNHIDVVFWTGFPETGGHIDPPFQSKARNMIRCVASPQSAVTNLMRPLRSSISFEVTPWLQQWVEARLKNWIGFGERKLCIIARNGYTSVGKNWGHLWRDDLPAGRRREGEECRDFMRLMLRKDPRWAFLSIEDRIFKGEHTVRDPELHSYSFAELFGPVTSCNVPFGILMKALIRMSNLVVGVPAGPYHLAMAKAEVPTVGVWIEHLPAWFDEPNACSVHVVSRNVRERGLDRRPGSVASSSKMAFRMIFVDTRIITGEQVMEAAVSLL
jgi:hypothetical protein